MHNIVDYIETPIGVLTISASDKGITSINFGRHEFSHYSGIKSEAKNHVEICTKQLSEYFSGERKMFSVPIDFNGTAFQEKVWSKLLEIPYGETISYKALASNIGNEKACRAVGMANNKNPLPILIPCHRVIGTSGKIIGYAGEFWRKEWLLENEKSPTITIAGL